MGRKGKNGIPGVKNEEKADLVEGVPAHDRGL